MNEVDSRVSLAISLLAPLRFEYATLPLYDKLFAYREEGAHVGGFLTALLSGDYKEAMARADDTNVWLMPIYAAFLYNEMPANAHGAPGRVAAWRARFQSAGVPA